MSDNKGDNLKHCNNCKENKKCRLCHTSGCNKCINTVCVDCCIEICKECRNNDDILCECYGNCTNCDTSVNRGSNGWPCDDCNKWLCHECVDEYGCNSCR